MKTLRWIPVIFSLVLAVWLFAEWKAPTNQELLANVAKALDFFDCMHSVGGWPWWTPNFLGGTSLAPAWGYMVTNLWLMLWISIFGIFPGALIAMLACLPLAAWTSFVFGRALTNSDSVAAVGAVLYVLSPSLWLRLVAVEHLVVVLALAILPLAFASLVLLVRSPGGWNASCAGASIALLGLTYSKALVLTAPFLFLFWFALSWHERAFRRQWESPVRVGFLASLFFLGALPLLPSVRESAFVILFSHGPFAAWQNTFSFKSGMQLLDRLGELSAGYAPGFVGTTGAGGFYVGSVFLFGLLLLWALWYFRPHAFRPEIPPIWGHQGFALRLSVAMSLFAIWLSAGPRNLLLSHFAGLEASAQGSDFTVVLQWGGILILCWLVWLLTPWRGLRRQLAAIGLISAFLLVPGFRILELLPFYNSIRAPFDFYQIPAPLFFSTIGGVVLVALWQLPWSKLTKAALCALGAALVIWDFAGFASLQKKNALQEGTWQNFQTVQELLGSEKNSGRVMPVSGRYFYLLTPQMSGRSLLLEAFQSYLQQRNFAWLMAFAQSQESLYPIGMRVAGAAYVLVDFERRADENPPTPPPGTRQIYVDQDFGLYEIANPLFPAFVVRDAVAVDGWQSFSFENALAAGRLNLAIIEELDLTEQHDGYAGMMRDGELKLRPDVEKTGGDEWRVLEKTDWQQVNTEEWRFRLGAEPGAWCIITQAWHPDWRAYSESGQKIPVGRAFGALPVIQIPKELPAGAADAEVVLRFEPPAWYGWAVSVAVVAWVIFLTSWAVRLSQQGLTRTQTLGVK